MLINQISAVNFRNLCIENIAFSPGLNVLYGKNAQGKTNILEAIYFCAFGRALRGKSDVELINRHMQDAFVKLEVNRGSQIYIKDIRLKKQGKKLDKSFLFDSVPVKHIKDIFGKLLIVMFGPEDLRLIKNGPSERRRFMDMEICQLSPIYYNDIKEYYRILKHRNALLKSLQKDKSSIDMLFIWDEQLVYYAKRINRHRFDFVEKINKTAGEIYKSIAKNEEIDLVYKPGKISEDSLKNNRNKDILNGSTSEGIHTDEIEFNICGINARSFASQGQQRSAVISTKLAEITLIKDATGETPILLLDDILSELDSYRQGFLFDFVKSQQTIVTAAGLNEFIKKASKKNNVMYVDNGKIKGAADG